MKGMSNTGCVRVLSNIISTSLDSEIKRVYRFKYSHRHGVCFWRILCASKLQACWTGKILSCSCWSAVLVMVKFDMFSTQVYDRGGFLGLEGVGGFLGETFHSRRGTSNRRKSGTWWKLPYNLIVLFSWRADPLENRILVWPLLV